MCWGNGKYRKKDPLGAQNVSSGGYSQCNVYCSTKDKLVTFPAKISEDDYSPAGDDEENDARTSVETDKEAEGDGAAAPTNNTSDNQTCLPPIDIG